MSAKRLALGTAQFGLPYGVANRIGQVGRDAATAILATATAAGVDTLDTAIAYGDSERCLGECGMLDWRVVTKLPRLQPHEDVSALVQQHVDESLARLRIPRLHALLLHRSRDLLEPWGESLHRALLAIKQQGRAAIVGISIYDPEELDAVWSRYPLDFVQAPFNVLDRRLETSGWLARLRKEGVEVHIRSIFLQGLLLMSPADRPAQFARWQHVWAQWHQWLATAGVAPLAACLGFALAHTSVDRIVVGVESVSQLREILAAAEAKTPGLPVSLATNDPALINPSQWSKA
jgi:aryl-alcohol dehydrogenase-like predicted oxidoreductase